MEINKSGVYKLTIRNHSYIGSSSNIYLRFKKHESSLRLGNHHNIFLQNCFNKYNELNIEILEFCEKISLIQKECEYIRAYNPDLNMKNPLESNSGFTTSDLQKETARKMCKQWAKDRKFTERIANSNKGQKRSKEICDKFKIINNRYNPEKIKKLREKNQFRILTESDVINIRNRLLNKERVIILAKEYCVSISTIYKIKQNRRWKFL